MQVLEASLEITSQPEIRSKLQQILIELLSTVPLKKPPAAVKSGKAQKVGRVAQPGQETSAVEKRGAVYVILDKHLMQLPLECMPIIKEQPVCRIPTIAKLQDVRCLNWRIHYFLSCI